MAKKIVIITNILIGLVLGGLFVWYQARRGASGFEPYAKRMGFLGMIALAQKEYQKATVRDEDKDGIGEYGTLADLFRSDGRRPSYVETVFEKYFKTHPPFGEHLDEWSLERNGTVEAWGYIYDAFLPGTADGRERNWCIFVHPWEFTHETSQTYFLEGRDITHAYFTLYESYAGPRRGPTLEKVYEGKPFESRIREYALPPGKGEHDRPLGNKEIRRAVGKVKRSDGMLWIRCRIGYPALDGGQKTTTEQK